MPYCSKCGRKLQNESARMMHEGNCKGEVEKEVKKRVEKKVEKVDEKCALCGGNIKLLSARNIDHKEAITSGYYGFCVKCLELV